MKNQFVTYEIALKLKELGFNEECLAIYTHNNEHYTSGTFFLHTPHPFTIEELTPKVQDIRESYVYILAPLWQQAIDWFRKEHEIIISIHYWGKRNATLNNRILYPNLCNYTICQELTPKEKWIEYWYDNYYNAREQAILKAIELIQKK